MNSMIAHCGLDCEKCDARIATVHNDDALREKTAELWNKLNGVNITKDMINCTGCRENGVKTPYCESLCEIRKCSLSKGYSSCGDCGGFETCRTVGMIISGNDGALKNLKGRSY